MVSVGSRCANVSFLAAVLPPHDASTYGGEMMEMSMVRSSVVRGIAILMTLSACTQAVVQKEDMLAAAGFDFRPANTPQKVAALKVLPPHGFVHEVSRGQTVWIYADPSICGCVYAGNDAAYQRYQQEVFQQRIAAQQVQAAQINENAAIDQNVRMMDWAVWGPWAPYYAP